MTHASHSAKTEAQSQDTPASNATHTRPAAATINGLAALEAVARLHHVAADAAALHHRLGLGPSEPAGIDHVVAGARLLGLKALRSRTTADRLNRVPLPALAVMRDGSLVVLARCDSGHVVVQAFPGGTAHTRVEPLGTKRRRWK